LLHRYRARVAAAKPARYTIHLNGPWCLIFEFEDGDAWRVDFDQYH
jgi:proteic killer suppression protein